MVLAFGPPLEGDGYKVSGQYFFTDERGDVFTLYDWKSTTLFEDDILNGVVGILTPEEFWASESPTTLNIGGREGMGNVSAFKQWLSERME